MFGRRSAGDRQHAPDLGFKLRKQRIDDVILVAKMVVQVAGRDIQFFGDDRRGDIRLAELVEQAQGKFKNPLARAPWRLVLHANRSHS
jgi:hypothetical protein